MCGSGELGLGAYSRQVWRCVARRAWEIINQFDSKCNLPRLNVHCICNAELVPGTLYAPIYQIRSCRPACVTRALARVDNRTLALEVSELPLAYTTDDFSLYTKSELQDHSSTYSPCSKFVSVSDLRRYDFQGQAPSEDTRRERERERV